MDTLDLFKRLPHLDEDRKVIDDWGYTPCLYHFDGEWHVSWMNCDDNDTIEDFCASTLEKAINDAFEWCIKNNLIETSKEPKFKVGDKIKMKVGTSTIETKSEKLTIIEIKSDRYIVEEVSGDFSVLPFVAEDYWELANKFDTSTLVPFESRVLVRELDNQIWKPAIWGFKQGDFYCVLGGEIWDKCIPYEGNEHLLGKEGDCNKYYKTWE